MRNASAGRVDGSSLGGWRDEPRFRLERIRPALNERRYYELDVTPDLFGGAALLRRWGRIGRPGRVRLDLHGGRDEAERGLVRLLRAKIRRGYAVCHGDLAGLDIPVTPAPAWRDAMDDSDDPPVLL